MHDQASAQPIDQANASAQVAPAEAQQHVAPSQPNVDQSALQRRLEIAEREAREARQEAAKYRTRNDEETAKRLQEQGDYKALYEKTLPDYETAKQKAERYDAFVQQQQKAIEAEVSTLPSFIQKAVSAAQSLEDKRAILDDFKSSFVAAPQNVPPRAPPISGAPAIPPSKPPTVEELVRSGMSVSEVQQKHPDIWQAELKASSMKSTFRY